MANHIQRAYKLKLDGLTVLGSTGEGRLTIFNEDATTQTVDLSELSVKVAELENCAPCYAAIGISNFDLSSGPTPFSLETTTRLTASGTVYLWATGSTLAAPTVAQITGSSYSFSAEGSVNTLYTLSDLTPNTTYKIYAYATDGDGNHTVVGGNGTKFTARTPESVNISTFSLDGSPTSSAINTLTTINEDGTIYVTAVESGSTAPSVSSIKASTFTSSVSADSPTSLTIDSLSPLTAYTAYVYAEDSNGDGTIIGGGNSLFHFTTNQALSISTFSNIGGNFNMLSHRFGAPTNATGYTWATGSGLAAPSIAQIESSTSTGLITAGVQNTSISNMSLQEDTPYTVYGYIKNSTGSSVIGGANSFYHKRTWKDPNPPLLGATGAVKSTSFSMFYESPVDETVYLLPWISGESSPSIAATQASPYTTGAAADTRYSFTFTGLNAATTYYIATYREWEAGVVAQGAGDSSSTAPFTATTNPANQHLISSGLVGRLFGWNDPDYVADSDYDSVSILDGGSVTPSSHEVVISPIEFQEGSALTGVLKNMAYSRTASTGLNGYAMTGMSFDGNNDFISLPQLQNNSKGLWNTGFAFLGSNSSDDASYGFSITYWLRPLWGIDHGPSSNQDYKPWNLGNSAARSLGLYHKFDGSDRPAQLRGNASNYLYSNSAANPPDPWDQLYDTGNWTFMSIVYDGSELAPGYSADKSSPAFMITLGTGVPTEGKVFFYSGDGSTAGIADDLTVQGSNYANYGTASNSLIDLTQNYCATLGVALKSDGSLQNSDLSYWPGVLSDFRIYNRTLSTGETYSIFTSGGAV